MSPAMSCQRFFWRCPIGSFENFGALISALKSLGTLSVLKKDSHNVEICEEAITRTLYGLMLTGILLKPHSDWTQPYPNGLAADAD